METLISRSKSWAEQGMMARSSETKELWQPVMGRHGNDVQKPTKATDGWLRHYRNKLQFGHWTGCKPDTLARSKHKHGSSNHPHTPCQPFTYTHTSSTSQQIWQELLFLFLPFSIARWCQPNHCRVIGSFVGQWFVIKIENVLWLCVCTRICSRLSLRRVGEDACLILWTRIWQFIRLN